MVYTKLHPRHFWSTDSGLTGLLIFFLGYLVVVTTLSEFSFGRIIARLLSSVVVITGVLTTFKQRWLHIIAIILAVATIGCNWLEEFWPGKILSLLNVGFSIMYLGLLLATLVLQVFREGPVTSHRICGAIVIYLLLGAYGLCFTREWL